MKPLGMHNYFVYITTNKTRKVLYVGLTNNLDKRLYYHEKDASGPKEHFAGRYNCIYLIYWERYQWVHDAIQREKEIKGWRREKKIKLINEMNPEWRFLNDEVGGGWF